MALLSRHMERWRTSASLFIPSTCVFTCLFLSPRPITQYPNGPVTKALARPAARLHATPAQVIQLWVRAKGAVVVTTTRKAERLQEYLGIERLGFVLL